jgi:hypothetical protein
VAARNAWRGEHFRLARLPGRPDAQRGTSRRAPGQQSWRGGRRLVHGLSGAVNRALSVICDQCYPSKSVVMFCFSDVPITRFPDLPISWSFLISVIRVHMVLLFPALLRSVLSV